MPVIPRAVVNRRAGRGSFLIGDDHPWSEMVTSDRRAAAGRPRRTGRERARGRVRGRPGRNARVGARTWPNHGPGSCRTAASPPAVATTTIPAPSNVASASTADGTGGPAEVGPGQGEDQVHDGGDNHGAQAALGHAQRVQARGGPGDQAVPHRGERQRHHQVGGRPPQLLAQQQFPEASRQRDQQHAAPGQPQDGQPARRPARSTAAGAGGSAAGSARPPATVTSDMPRKMTMEGPHQQCRRPARSRRRPGPR